jgi:hypothetical protein
MGMGACYSGRPRAKDNRGQGRMLRRQARRKEKGSGIFQWEIQGEDGAFPDQAFYLDLSLVRVHDGLYIAQPQAKALDIV